jgi:hypothetical protein
MLRPSPFIAKGQTCPETPDPRTLLRGCSEVCKLTIDRYHVFPDGALTSLPNPDGGFQMYWSNCEVSYLLRLNFLLLKNYRTTGWGPNTEAQTAVNPWIPYPQIYFGGRTNAPGYANGGKWYIILLFSANQSG